MDFIETKSIITTVRNQSWFGVDYNMNIYRGCNHGCIYCDSRSECYRIDEFNNVRAKKNSTNLIEYELKRKTIKGVIGTGAMSDPYNPFEKEYELTRSALKIINRYNFGVAIATKSDLIVRDKDLLKEIGKHSPVIAKITITTFNDELAKKLEPNAPSSSRRFKAIRELREEGIFAGILLMPVLPFIEDNEENIINIVRLAHENHAKFIYPAFGVTLRDKQRDYYFENIDKIFPNLKTEYIKNYGFNYECRSVEAQKLWEIFKKECKKYNIIYKMRDIINEYKNSYEKQQLSFF